MSSILQGTPKVLVIQETSMQPGRDKLQGIFNYVRLFGPWHLHLIQSRASEQKIRGLSDWNAYDGIIADQLALGLADVVRQTRKPVVLTAHCGAGARLPAPLSALSCVMEDSARIGEAAAHYFLERGFKHFAYLGEPLNRSWSGQRGEAFARRLQAAGHICDRHPERAAADDWKAERQRLLEWLRTRPKPLALLAAMDARAHETIDACAEAGLQVPHDVAVLGVDNDELICNGAIPTLSSIQRDTLTCGFLAAQLLDRQMRRGARKRQVLTYGVSRIVARDSTQTGTAPADLVAARAREFIRINAGERIGVPDVVRHLNVSRRLAELRFRAAFGTSLLKAIRNARLERVQRLLVETDLSLAEVCSRCDYQTDIHLRRLFKARFGCSMREYRRRQSAAPPDGRGSSNSDRCENRTGCGWRVTDSARRPILGS